jgi:tight adherence protein C
MSFVLGSFIGLGLVLLVVGLRPRRRPLQQLVAELTGRQTVRSGAELSTRKSPAFRDIDNRYGPRIARSLQLDADHCKPQLCRDLRMAGMSAEQFAVDKVMLAGFGVVIPTVFLVLLQTLGVGVPLVAILCVGVIFGLVGLITPNLLLTTEAARYRKDFRHGLSSLLELVSIGMAGGAQVQNAMADAIRAGRPAGPMTNSRGEGWVFQELASPIDKAVQERQPPWEHIAQLGDELGIPELGELTSSIKAAGSEGANVRNSLAARAQSLRARRVAELEGEAGETSQKMSFPIALLAFGFLIFIGYPAVMRVFSGFA